VRRTGDRNIHICQNADTRWSPQFSANQVEGSARVDHGLSKHTNFISYHPPTHHLFTTFDCITATASLSASEANVMIRSRAVHQTCSFHTLAMSTTHRQSRKPTKKPPIIDMRREVPHCHVRTVRNTIPILHSCQSFDGFVQFTSLEHFFVPRTRPKQRH
jgi:hypothetical protein